MQGSAEEWAQAIERDGFVYSAEGCSENLITGILGTSHARIERVMSALGDREIGIGSAAGFDELVQRSPGRWDLPISPAAFGLDDRQFPWWPTVAKILGDDAEHSFSGVVYSDPETPAQEWHIDSPHESADHLPAHAINVLVALQAVSLDMGPTEIAVGSHRLTNHLLNRSLDREELVYQHATTSPERLVEESGDAAPQRFVSEMPAGSFIVFDDRLMHRGLGNQSGEKRYMAYFSYRKAGYSENTHFEAQRSVFDPIR